ncbi:MAG: GxxExxY protein [bacterium]|nr:GxxExxY protein [bacterium]
MRKRYCRRSASGGELCGKVRQTAFNLHAFLRHGHLEKVYENGLAHRLHKAGLKVEQQQPLKVYDEDGTVLGDYFADLLVEPAFAVTTPGIIARLRAGRSELIIELKAGKTIADEHIAQALGYLRASGHRHACVPKLRRAGTPY